MVYNFELSKVEDAKLNVLCKINKIAKIKSIGFDFVDTDTEPIANFETSHFYNTI